MKRQIKNLFLRLCGLSLIVTVLCMAMPVSMVYAAGGKTYYVAADGTGNGLSESDPMSFFKANGTVFNGGDKVLFRRGDTFYGTFLPLVYNASNTKRVEVGAYGTGALPILSNAKVVSSAWTRAGQFYVFELSANGKYQGVKNNDANIGFIEDSNGVKHGIRRKDAADCTNEYDFYCSGTKVYVKSSKDPYAALGKLVLNTHYDALIRAASNMNIHDLHLRDAGYGIVWAKGATQENLSVYNCVFDNIGGNIIDEANFTKAGNAIELYGGGSNVTVEKNLFRDVYDVAFTCQGYTPGIWRNITVKQNVFVNNTQAIEIWSGASAGGTGVNNLTFAENVCINQGEGWGTDARPNKTAATDFLAYGYSSPVWRMSITGNTFYHSAKQGASYVMPSATLSSFQKKVTSDNNHFYYPTQNSVFARWEENPAYSYTFQQWKTTVQLDANSTFTAIGGGSGQQRAMEKMAASSLSFNDIVRAVKNAGVVTTIEVATVDSSATTTKPTTTTTTGSKASTSTTTTSSLSTSDSASITDHSSSAASDTSSKTDTSVTTDPTVQPAGPGAERHLPPVWWIAIAGGAVVLIGGCVVLYMLVIRKTKVKSVQKEGEENNEETISQ